MLKAILSKKELSEQSEFFGYVQDLLQDEAVSRLKDFRHHIGTTRFQHSLNVSYYNFLLCKKLKLDARAAARAGLLHDLFFYDRRKHINVESSHAAEHSKEALKNASERFDLSELEQDMIVNHMWPATKARPKFKETYAITLVDKFCATAEFSKMVYNYAISKTQMVACLAAVICLRLTLK